MTNDDSEALKQAIRTLAALAATMEQREGRIRDFFSQELKTLQHQVSAQRGEAQRIHQTSVGQLAQQAQQAIQAGVAPGVADIKTAASQVRDASSLSVEAQQVSAQRMTRLTAILFTAGILLMLLALTTLWLTLGHYKREIDRNAIEAELLRAYNHADVTLCEGKLCANVEPKGKKYGDKKQYRLVQSRP